MFRVAKVLLVAAALLVLAASASRSDDPTAPILFSQYTVAFMERIDFTTPTFYAGYIYYDYDTGVTRTDYISPGLYHSIVIDFDAHVEHINTATNGHLKCNQLPVSSPMVPPDFLQEFEYAGEEELLGVNCYMWSGREGPLNVVVYTDAETGGLVGEHDMVEANGEENTDMFYYQGYVEGIPSGFDLRGMPNCTAQAMHDGMAAPKLPGLFRMFS